MRAMISTVLGRISSPAASISRRHGRKLWRRRNASDRNFDFIHSFSEIVSVIREELLDRFRRRDEQILTNCDRVERRIREVHSGGTQRIHLRRLESPWMTGDLKIH